MKNLNAQLKGLKALKDHPRFGGRSVEFYVTQEAKLMAAIGHEPSATPVRYGLGDYVEYYKATLGPVMMRSMAGATAGIAFLLGGWLTTVNAATNSLPGDSLYGLKLITEQMQLRMSSLEERAVLHTEFAERRLQEVVELQQNGDADAVEVRVAFDGFKREVTSANDDLQTLQQTGSADAVATAGKVEGKLASLDAVLDQSAAVGDATSVVQEAIDLSREAQSAAVTVAVDSHTTAVTAESTQELQQMYMRRLGDLEARQAFDLHRVDVLRKARASDDQRLAGITLPTTTELGMLEKKIKDAEIALTEATAAYGGGNFRVAFDILNGVDGTLQLVEFNMAQAEIAITQAFAQPIVSELTPTEMPVQEPENIEPQVNSDTTTVTE